MIFVGVFCRNWTSLSKVTLDLFFFLLLLLLSKEDDDGVNDGVVIASFSIDDEVGTEDGVLGTDDIDVPFFFTGVEEDAAVADDDEDFDSMGVATISSLLMPIVL